MIFKIIKKNNQSGLSILEALVAVVVFVLGLAGIYMMSTLSNRAMISSIERDKLNMVSAMVIESMTIDTANIATYDDTDCWDPYESSSGSSLKDRNRKKWAKKYKKIIEARDSSGNVISDAKEGSEDCKVEVKVIENENAHMITIIMTRKNGKKIQLSKRINNK